jgi:hypothetical protein
VPPAQSWSIALVPDRSGRFGKASDYTALGTDPPVPWSRPRPAELWMAFSLPAPQGTVIDLTLDDLKKTPRPLELRLDAAATGFQTLHTAKDLVVRARVWDAGDGTPPRGLLVLATGLQAKEAALIGVAVRVAGQRTAAAARSRPAVAPVAAPPAAVRLMAFDPARREGSHYHVETLVRFDPLRPPEPGDEKAAERLNAALMKRGPAARSAFGVDRPFRIEWEIQAFRDEGCAPVSVQEGEPPATPNPNRVVVKPKAGEVTGLVTVNQPPLPPETAARGDVFADVVSAGTLVLAVPEGVSVVGQGTLRYLGKDVGLAETATTLVFELPLPDFRNEWDLIQDVLAHIDAGGAGARLQALKRAACAPAAEDCTLDALSRTVAAGVRDPVQRWPLLRGLRDPESAYARFARHLALAFLADRELEFGEYARLDRLLRRNFGPPAAGPVTRNRCLAAVREP